MPSMKPITLSLPPDYGAIMEQLRAQIQEGNPDGRVISRTHILRYALRQAVTARASVAVARQVLESEGVRGKVRAAKPSKDS